ncbi:hypothetical protein AGR4C_Cc150072 [Agrobacterium tumefaciens str. Kerr 14]|uniref:Uncharacterized protein n=1 Tax=Agrobacterium tumefaciens str. Kerr 14 TaxID=1183424 RepID=A0A1S7P110_AGRTU|nr:hypothetical protein AGR4C_Cc150072 [Agrobacterium tumefaciens str. Kerr 14]
MFLLAGARAAARPCDGLFVVRFAETAHKYNLARQGKDPELTMAGVIGLQVFFAGAL